MFTHFLTNLEKKQKFAAKSGDREKGRARVFDAPLAKFLVTSTCGSTCITIIKTDVTLLAWIKVDVAVLTRLLVLQQWTCPLPTCTTRRAHCD